MGRLSYARLLGSQPPPARLSGSLPAPTLLHRARGPKSFGALSSRGIAESAARPDVSERSNRGWAGTRDRGGALGGWGPFGAPMTKRFDSLGALGYKVRVLSPFPAMETYADH